MFLTKSFVWVKVVSGPGWTDVLQCSDDARVRPLDEREDCQKRGTLGHIADYSFDECNYFKEDDDICA